ncbi:MAG: glycosyltransferase family 4 protein [Clostridiales bacterium]|nr:glycosyltransferase family 4 protein [Candidatus Scatonaster coprocaballi]
MKIWYIHESTMLPEHGALNRGYYLGKNIKALGHEPTVFVGSHPHNTDMQLIKGRERFHVYTTEPCQWVCVKTLNYEGSKLKRIFSMFIFYHNMKKTAKKFEKPDAIIGSSSHPLAALVAIKLGKKYGRKSIVEVRDLWPESIVSFGVAKRSNPLVKLMYSFEKYLYKHADELVFTMENAWQYFEDRGLDKYIPREKVHYVNNGIDLNDFNFNKDHYSIEDADLEDDKLFKVVYVGSIRKVNNVGKILDVAKCVKNSRVKFLIWGDGYELESLKKRLTSEKIENVSIKGRAEKKYIPYITSHANLNYMHVGQASVLKYGISANKMFDYAAAGKPIISDFACGMNPADVYKAGLTCSIDNVEKIAELIDGFAVMGSEEYKGYCDNAVRLAEDYSFEILAQKMIDVCSKDT